MTPRQDEILDRMLEINRQLAVLKALRATIGVQILAQMEPGENVARDANGTEYLVTIDPTSGDPYLRRL